jgi:hypothetical protein
MATVVAKTGIRREQGWLYFLDKQGDVSRVRMQRSGQRVPKGRQKVAKCGVDDPAQDDDPAADDGPPQDDAQEARA